MRQHWPMPSGPEMSSPLAVASVRHLCSPTHHPILSDPCPFSFLAVANPDLPYRIREGIDLQTHDRATFYTDSADGARFSFVAHRIMKGLDCPTPLPRLHHLPLRERRVESRGFEGRGLI